MKLPGLHFLDHPIYALLTTVSSCPIVTFSCVKPCNGTGFPRQFVIEFGDSRRFWRQSPNSTTIVASVDRPLYGIRVNAGESGRLLTKLL